MSFLATANAVRSAQIPIWKSRLLVVVFGGEHKGGWEAARPVFLRQQSLDSSPADALGRPLICHVGFHASLTHMCPRF